MDTSDSKKPHGRLTIIVPVTNMSGRLHWVEELLEGASGPVIVVHDARDASTGMELSELVARFPTSRLIEGSFGSPGVARMAGLATVATEYVAFMDSDDETFGGSGALQLATMLDESGNDICAGTFKVRNLENNWERIYPVSETFEEGLERHPGLWRYVFRVEFLRNSHVEFTGLKIGEDLLFLLDTYLSKARFQSSPLLVYCYHLGVQGQATNSQIAKRDLIPLMTALEDRYAGKTKDASSLISFLWMKTFLSASKNLTTYSARIRLIRYFSVSLIRYPLLITRGLIHSKRIIQNSGSFNMSKEKSKS